LNYSSYSYFYGLKFQEFNTGKTVIDNLPNFMTSELFRTINGLALNAHSATL